jgi:hypothetical protein
VGGDQDIGQLGEQPIEAWPQCGAGLVELAPTLELLG